MKKPLSKTALFSLIGGLAVFVCLTVLSIWVMTAVYVKRSDNGFIRLVASWLPAAKIGSETIPYSEFIKTRDTLKVYMSSQAAKDAGMAQPITSDVEKNSFERLMRERIVAQYAYKNNIKINDQDVRASFSDLVMQTSSTIPNVAQYLSDNFKWTEEDFREKVVRPAILEEKVAAALTTSTADQYIELESLIKKRMADADVKIYLKF